MLPLDYDPDIIADYWGRRPVAVATRVVQLLGIAGGFLGGLALDFMQNRIEQNQVRRLSQYICHELGCWKGGRTSCRTASSRSTACSVPDMLKARLRAKPHPANPSLAGECEVVTLFLDFPHRNSCCSSCNVMTKSG